MLQLQQKGTLFKQVSKAAKKLVSVSATSMLMIDTRKETLERVSCIHYLVQFKNTGNAPV